MYQSYTRQTTMKTGSDIADFDLRLSAERRNRSSPFQSEQQRRKAWRANDVEEIVRHTTYGIA